MRFGDGGKYGSGIGFGTQGTFMSVHGFTYYVIDSTKWDFYEPEIEPLPPVELRWTLMNTSWKKGKRR